MAAASVGSAAATAAATGTGGGSPRNSCRCGAGSDVLENARLGVDERAQLHHHRVFEAFLERRVKVAKGHSEHLGYSQALQLQAFSPELRHSPRGPVHEVSCCSRGLLRLRSRVQDRDLGDGSSEPELGLEKIVAVKKLG